MPERTMIDRMLGAAMLDVAVYEEVEADETATAQAAGVVAMVAVAQGIAGIGGPGRGLILGPLAALIAWVIWAGVTYVVGDKIFGGTATWGELLRTLGFAQAPGILLVLAILPLGFAVRGFVGLWMLVTGIVAIRQALDFGTGKALLTAWLGWLPAQILMYIAGV